MKSTHQKDTGTKRQLKIAFLPDWSRENPYQNLLKKSLEQHNALVRLYNYPSSLFPLNRLINNNRDLDVIHIHWINDLIAGILWSNNSIFFRIKLAILGLDILISRLRGTSVVWTIHNLVSHESNNQSKEFSIRRTIVKSCSRVIVHSASAKRILEEKYSINLDRKASVIPHGNYDGCYDSPAPFPLYLQKLHETKSDFITILFFGAIRPYKGIDKLIDAFSSSNRKDIRLVIAGKPNTPELRAALQHASEIDSRIHCFLDFIPDSEVAHFFSISDIVSIPFERTLTSGSAVLAVTMGKPLLLPEEAKVLDLANDSCAYFFHSDADLRDRINLLSKVELQSMQAHSTEVSNSIKWTDIAHRTASVYKE